MDLSPEERRLRRNEIAKRWREANRDKIRAIEKAYRERNPEARAHNIRRWRQANKEHVAEYKKQWRTANPEKHRASARRRNDRWEANNPERAAEVIRKKAAKWANANPDKRALYHSRGHVNRRTKLKNAGSFTLAEWAALLDQTGHKCACCGVSEMDSIYRYPKKGKPLRGKLTVDHIVPLRNGGTGTINNVQPLCLSCNMRKHAREINHLGLQQTQYRSRTRR